MRAAVRSLVLALALVGLPTMALAQEAAPRRVAVLASLDVGFAFDGLSPNAQPGALARIGADLGDVELTLEAHGGGPDTIDTPRVAYHVARGAIRLEALLEAFDDGEWRIPLGVAVGLSGWARLSTPHDPTLDGTSGATSGGFTAGLVGRVQWLPRALGGVIGIEIGLGADVVVPEPRFVLVDGATTTVLGVLWPVSPHVSAGIVVRAFP